MSRIERDFGSRIDVDLSPADRNKPIIEIIQKWKADGK